MNTIVGKIEDASGNPLGVVVQFVSQSTPQFSGEVAITNSTLKVKSDPTDGTFSIILEPGYYSVTYFTIPDSTAFTIAVGSGSSTVNIGDIVTSPVVPLPSGAPYLLWNGVWAGDVQFDPTINPTAPTLMAVDDVGGHQMSSDSFDYAIAWETSVGTTAISPTALSTGPTGSNNATRVTLPSPPSGVTSVLIYRSNNDSTGNLYLLETVIPSTAYYDDWESQSDFAGILNPAQVAPQANTTSGTIYSSAGNPSINFSDFGIGLLNLTYMLGTNTRWKPGYGIQIYNSTTELWHTILCINNPAQFAYDDGMN